MAAIAATPSASSLSSALTGATNTGVNLSNMLDSAQYTVFAPVDTAFAKLPVATLGAFKNTADAGALTKLLEFHIVPGQLAPASISGTHTTLQGETLTVQSAGTVVTVDGANVVCGGIKTTNATLYFVDTVLTPPATN